MPVKREKILNIRGINLSHKKKMKNRMKTSEYLSSAIRRLRSFLGKKVKRIFDPSSGGIGMRLKNANTKKVT